MATMAVVVRNTLGQTLNVDDDLVNSLLRKIPLGDVNVAQTAATLTASGVRAVTVAIPGAKAGEDVLLFPVGPLPVGYVVGPTAVMTADGVASVSVIGPALALGATYSIPCRAIALRNVSASAT